MGVEMKMFSILYLKTAVTSSEDMPPVSVDKETSVVQVLKFYEIGDPVYLEFNIPVQIDIRKGSDAQRVSVLHTLPQLLLSPDTERISRELVPCIIELARGSAGRSKIFHQAASDNISQVICQQGRNVHPSVLNTLLHFAGGNIVHPDQAIAEIWINMLLTVMESVPRKVVQSVILPAAANAAWHDEQQRIFAAVIFGKMCSLPGTSELRDAVIPKLIVLCHDPEWRVRTAACQQFVYATHCFASSPKLISEFLALGSDESEEVRAAVISAAASILSGQHAHIVIQSVAPLVMSLAKESLRECSSVLISVARHFGELSFALHCMYKF
ncbi:uncharacterized protein LOC126188522 [Schistocerca cancellata]|uniref:uncharacterized protein LOC126188522 n=1 Tax=Schistocerca cancellata TaxID=274614 RepID=UPI00211820EC|nr:uncharacterized protein LOC126188522 [Schistocerca cancellata]